MKRSSHPLFICLICCLSASSVIATGYASWTVIKPAVSAEANNSINADASVGSVSDLLSLTSATGFSVGRYTYVSNDGKSPLSAGAIAYTLNVLRSDSTAQSVLSSLAGTLTYAIGGTPQSIFSPGSVALSFQNGNSTLPLSLSIESNQKVSFVLPERTYSVGTHTLSFSLDSSLIWTARSAFANQQGRFVLTLGESQ